MPKNPKLKTVDRSASSSRGAGMTSDPAKLPPYGYIHDDWTYDIRTRRVPAGFRIAGRPAGETDYIAWLEATVDELAEFLWPRYDKATQTWIGKAQAKAWALTVADLDLMDTGLHDKLCERAPSRDPLAHGSHKAFFVAEDLEAMLDTFAKYETALTPELVAKLKEEMGKGLKAFGPAPLRFKEYFQRPRPYQAAYLLGRPFAYEWAKSAVTPSMISGHSLQGLIAGCYGYISLMRKLDVVAGAVDNLLQWSVDVGDRRVFAGVHYPSDNLSSWYIALKLCDNYVFGELGLEAKEFLKKAIHKSAVFLAMQAAVDADPASPFAAPLARLSV